MTELVHGWEPLHSQPEIYFWQLPIHSEQQPLIRGMQSLWTFGACLLCILLCASHNLVLHWESLLYPLMLNFSSFVLCYQWKVEMMRLDGCLHMLNMPQGPDGSTWVIWHSSGWPTLQNFEAIHWLRRHMKQQCESQSKLQYVYIMIQIFGTCP